jgi:CrcB protein
VNTPLSTPLVQYPHERHYYEQAFLEQRYSQRGAYPGNRIHENGEEQSVANDSDGQPAVDKSEMKPSNILRSRVSNLATEFYAVSYLISFSILGCLARLGLQNLTAYNGSPVTTNGIWTNFAGCIIMGFLTEDKSIFESHQKIEDEVREEEMRQISNRNENTLRVPDQPSGPRHEYLESGMTKDQKTPRATKETIPLYIGLTTGFCGSVTSFSSFIRDVFLELSNQPPAGHPSSSSASAIVRNGGHSFMAVIAVVILTISLCVSALKFGAHLAIGLENILPSLPFFLARKPFHRCIAILSWGVWLGSILLAILLSASPSGPAAQQGADLAQETWRGDVLFALVFAPVGCILRFYASSRMNVTHGSFPLGTFIVNISGTTILGICWDLQHVSLGAGESIRRGRVGCQILQGIDDGFCGCLTTISTWVIELTSLRRKYAYIYGCISVFAGLACLVVIMGSLIWSQGVSSVTCAV